MRKKHFEVTDQKEILAILDRCMVCRIAMNEGDYPYIVPLNFGYSCEGDEISFYFHSANLGKKIEMLRENGNVGFELDTSHRVVFADKPCDFAMEYESVIGTGQIRFLENEEKPFALSCIMKQYDKQKEYKEFDPKMIEITAVMKLTVKELSCKRIKK